MVPAATALLILAIIIGAPIGIAFFALFMLAYAVNRIEQKAAKAALEDRSHNRE